LLQQTGHANDGFTEFNANSRVIRLLSVAFAQEDVRALRVRFGVWTMTPARSHGLQRQMLLEAGVDLSRPDPGLVWCAFKRFASEPIECDGEWLEFRTGTCQSADLAWGYFDFQRLCYVWDPEDEQTAYWGIDFHFWSVAAASLGLNELIWSKRFPDHPTFVEAVEQSAAFRVGVKFVGWSFEASVSRKEK
jgi:hypothetical protein